MSDRKHELILFGVAMLISAVLILYNTFTAPDLKLRTDTQSISRSFSAAPPVVSQESAIIVNINSADIDELTLIKGIGEAKASAIIDYRTENGLFESVEELVNVSGIGEKLLKKIYPYVTV